MKSEIWNLYFLQRSRNSKYHFLLEELHVFHWFISSASPENTLHQNFQISGPLGLALFQQEVGDRCELLLIDNTPSAGAASFQCTPAS